MPVPERPAYHLYRWLWGSLDLLFPPICGGCGRPGTHWCIDCQNQVKKIQPPFCNICSQPRDVPGLCFRCSTSKPHFSKLRSWAVYDGPVREAIRNLKYRRNISLGLILSKPLVNLFEELGWDVDMIVPVPLGVARLKERGYNQAALIARPLALRIDVPCKTQVLHRVKETRTQVGLSGSQRHENVKNAFQAIKDPVSKKRVLVVDDVATSSATLDACASALLRAGADTVYCLTLARAGERI
jgi:competence protein ComFC